MVGFLECSDGTLVNIAHVLKIVPVLGDRAAIDMEQSAQLTGYRVHTVDGDAHDAPIEAAQFLSLAIVPASAEAKALCVFCVLEEGRPTAQQLVTRWLPIIAWRVEYLVNWSPLPVFPETLIPNEKAFILMPDGKLLHASDVTFDNEAAARRYVLEAAQRDWDAQQPG